MARKIITGPIVDRHGTLDIVCESDWASLVCGNGTNLSSGIILGASVNTFLLGAFLYHSRLRSSFEMNDEELPGGVASWKDLCEVLYVTLPSVLTISELSNRVLLLVDALVGDEALFMRQHQQSAVQPFADSGTSYSKSQSFFSTQPQRKSLESCNLVSGSLAFLLEYLRGYHVYLSAHQLCEVKTLVYEVCARLRVSLGNSTGDVGFSSKGSALSLLGINEVRHDLIKLRNMITDIVVERSWIDAGCIPVNLKLIYHASSALSELSVGMSMAGSLRCKSAPYISQIKGDWTGAAIQARRKTVKEALARTSVHISVFGGANILDELNDESDDDDYLPYRSNGTVSSIKKEGIEIDYPAPRVPTAVSLLQDPSTIDFWSVDPLELARQWTLVDHSLFAGIPPACLLFVTWTEPRYRMIAVPIRRFIDRFNTASLWTTASLLSCQTTQERADRYSDLISLAEHLKNMGNFNGLMSVLTGLQQACITRMHDMLSLVSQEDKERLAGFQHTMAGNKNYGNYRDALRAYDSASGVKDKAGRAIVPHLGAHLAELTTIAEGNPEFLPDYPHLLNTAKKKLMARSVALLVELQQRRYCIVPVRLVSGILARALEKHVHLTGLEASDVSKKLFDLSMYLEPAVKSSLFPHHSHHPCSHSNLGSSDRDITVQPHMAAQPRSYQEVGRHTSIVEYELVESESASSVDSDEEKLSVHDKLGKSPSKSKYGNKMGKGWDQLKFLMGTPLGFGTASKEKEKEKRG